MKRDDIFEKVRTIIAEILRCDPGELSLGTTPNDVERWDSLTNINIIVSLESAFSVKFALGEIQELKSIGDLVNFIVEKTA